MIDIQPDNLSGTLAVGPTGKKPADVRNIWADHIDVGERLREVDPARVKELAESFLLHGQLQPIGVRRKKERGYDLVFGAHRLAAAYWLFENGKTEEALIWATIYREDYPEAYIRMSEIVENLHRKELTNAERAGHLALYASWLKKLKLVESASNKQSAMMKTSKNPRCSDVGGHDVPRREITLPTVTEKLSTDLGIDPKMARRRIRNAVILAEQAGLVLPNGIKTLEKLDGDTLIAIGESALKQAQKKKELAKETGRSESRTLPIKESRRKPTTYNLNLDVLALPEQFIKWCERATKFDPPLTKEVLEQTSAELRKLIDRL